MRVACAAGNFVALLQCAMRRGSLHAVSDPAITTTTSDSISADERAAVIGGLVEFNVAQTGTEHRDYRELYVLARRDGELIGGLLGSTHWNWLFISHLWLAESARRSGVGRQLIEAAEQEAARRGCAHVHCDTFDFQALGFYQKLGFEIFGQLENYPPGHTRYYLQKHKLTPARSIVVETERLILRRMSVADASFMLETLNEPSFIRNVADRGVRTVEDAADYIRSKMLPSYEHFGFGFYIVELKESATPIGVCGIVKRETMEDVDVGYSLLDRFAGNGYAYEAAAAVMEYGRTTHGLKRIVGVTSPDNHRSIKLLEKLGLRYEKMVQLSTFETPSALYA